MGSPKNTTAQRSAFGVNLSMHLGSMSKSELARRIGISRQALDQWIDGSTDPAPSNVFAAEKALGLPPGALSHIFGYVPVGAWSTEAAITSDPHLSDTNRRRLLALYRQLRGS